MRTPIVSLLTIAALIAVCSTIDAQIRRTNRSASVSVNRNGPVTDCGDIRVTYDRRPAITEEAEMNLPPSQVSTLRAQNSRGGIYINGWDRGEYSVRTCKAVPDNDSNAASTLRDIVTEADGTGQLAVNGPAGGDWTANIIIMVPRLSTMDIQTLNGPLQVRDLAGTIRLNATNGPVSLHNVGGVVNTTANNGPISLTGASGDQRVTANNGPISVQLSGSRWDGPGLEVSTRNGPLSVSIPDAYGSGVWIQTSGSSPVNCKAPACAQATMSAGSPRVIRLGSGDPVVRLSSANGPLSIHGQ